MMPQVGVMKDLKNVKVDEKEITRLVAIVDSMTDKEVKTIVNAWKTGQKIAGRPGKALQKALQPFDPSLNVNNAKLPDGGKLNFPKIFRRQATFWTEVGMKQSSPTHTPSPWSRRSRCANEPCLPRHIQ